MNNSPERTRERRKKALEQVERRIEKYTTNNELKRLDGAKEEQLALYKRLGLK
jgi:hypothetical protein